MRVVVVGVCAAALSLALMPVAPSVAVPVATTGSSRAAVAVPANLVSVNQASVESSLRGFAAATGRERLLRTAALGLVGRSSLEIISTTKRSMALRTVMQGQVVTVGATYAAGVYVRPVSKTRRPASVRVQIVFASSTGHVLRTRIGAWTAPRVSRWIRVAAVGARAPAGTASVSVWLVVASTRAKDAYLADGWGLWRSSAKALPRFTMPVSSPDTIRPTAPARVLVAPSGDPGTLTVSWAASTDNVAVRRYRVTLTPLASGSPVVGWATGTRWTSGLIPLGPWRASVVAYDLSGWASAAGSATGTLGIPGDTVNLLTANQSSVETSTAGFDPASGTAPVTIGRSTGVAAAGVGALQIMATGSGQLDVRTARNWTPAYAGSPYSASVAVRASTGAVTGVLGHLEMRFYSADATVAPVVRRGVSVALTTSGWTRLTLAGQLAPSTAQYVTVGVVIESASPGQVHLADEFGLWRSATVPTWASPPARTPRPLLVVLGDSYVSGLGASVEARRWSTQVASTQGWLEANLGRGGTGWTATAGLSGCGLSLCPSVADMAVAAVAARPDVVLVSAGRNDLAAYASTPASVQGDVERAIATLRAGLPGARIVVVSPMWDSSAVNPGIPVIAGWAQQSAAAHGAQFVPDASSWLLGHPEWVFDGVHPNDAGYTQIAANVLGALG